jgi:hypothetical protein
VVRRTSVSCNLTVGMSAVYFRMSVSLSSPCAGLRRSTRRSHARRYSRQHHSLLAHEHGGLLRPPLLGEQAAFLRPEGRPHTRCRERLSGRDLYGSAQLDGECLPATGSLQSPRQGRTLCGVGAAGGVYGRTSFELQVLAMSPNAATAFSHERLRRSRNVRSSRLRSKQSKGLPARQAIA